MKKICLYILVFLPFLCIADDSEIRRLHHAAEGAMSQKNYPAAKEAYESLLRLINQKMLTNPKRDLEWITYIDLIQRYAYVKHLLGETEECRILLQRLLERNPPAEYLPQISTQNARMLCEMNRSEEAFLLLHQAVQSVPLNKWKADECSFFHALEFTLDSHFDELLQKGEQYYVSKFYKEAIELYEKIIEGITKGFFPKASSDQSNFVLKKVQFRLAEAHYHLAQYDKAIALADTQSLESEIDKDMLYLQAFAYKARHDYIKTIDCLDRYVNCQARKDLKYYDEAICELGILYFKNHNEIQAKRYFLALFESPLEKYQRAHFLAAMYLSKILLAETKPKKVEELLSQLMSLMERENPLTPEFASLRGDAAFMSRDYGLAIEMYEQAVEGQKNEEWKNKVRYQLALVYIKLAEFPSAHLKTETTRAIFLTKAEKLIERLKRSSISDEKLTLTLCKIHQIHLDVFHDQASLMKIVEDLSNSDEFSDEGQLEALLIKAKYASSLTTAEEYYQLACDARFKKCNRYAYTWYLRGLNHFQRSLSGLSQLELLDKAGYCLQKSFNLTENKTSLEGFNILKSLAQVNYFHNNFEGRVSAYLMLEHILQQFEHKLTQDDYLEVLFFKLIVAAQLAKLDQKDDYITLTQKTFEQLHANYPDAEKTIEGLNILASLYYHKKNHQLAEHYYEQLIVSYPDSIYIPETLFWLAQVKELNQEKQQAFDLRKLLISKYSHLSIAAEAFFQIFPLETYLSANQESIKHLESFIRQFPTSPFAIFGYYFLGKAEKNLTYYQNCIALFNELHKAEKISALSYDIHQLNHKLLIVKFQASLELAKIWYQNAEFTQCESLLTTLRNDTNDALDMLISSSDAYPSYLEEVEFLLAQTLLANHDLDKAQQLFSDMLHRYAIVGLKESPILAKIWNELGGLARNCKDFQTALECFILSEEHSLKTLPKEDILPIWIAQSECYKELHQYDNAMLVLSKVINEEVASPLRIQAMFLRAEVYELEGRYELAIRQLESTKKKGGQWGELAGEKLQTHYR